MMVWLIGAAGAWFLLDFCYHGSTISTPAILTLLNPHASEPPGEVTDAAPEGTDPE